MCEEQGKETIVALRRNHLTSPSRAKVNDGQITGVANGIESVFDNLSGQVGRAPRLNQRYAMCPLRGQHRLAAASEKAGEPICID